MNLKDIRIEPRLGRSIVRSLTVRLYNWQQKNNGWINQNMEWKNNWLWNQEIPRSIEYEWKKDVNVIGINEFDTFGLSGGQIEFGGY